MHEHTVEIAHEQLATQWLHYQRWIANLSGDPEHGIAADPRGDDLRLLQSLIADAARWKAAPDDEKARYHATRVDLELYQQLASRRGAWLSEVERQFVAASAEADEKERIDREAQQRRARWAIAGATLVIFLVSLMFFVVALYQARQTAKREAVVLTSVAHRAIADQRYETAMRIALHGLPARGDSPLALGWSTPEMSGLEAKLAGAAQLSPLFRELKGHDAPVTSAAFSADGARIVTASNDRTARVWDAGSGEMLRELKGHGGAVTSAAFSADGARIVTASGDRTARVWDAGSGEMLRELKGDGGVVSSAAFSADGARIVSASGDRAARVWDVRWGMTVRRDELVRRVCAEKLVGGKRFTTEDASDPILSALAGTNPCERRGPLSAKYWADLGSSIWAWAKARVLH